MSAIIYKSIYKKLQNKCSVYSCPYISFPFLHRNDFTFLNKFHILDVFLKSILHTPVKKNAFFRTFYRVQKIYWALNRFAFICKFKKASTQITTDLLMNDINLNKKSTCICLLHENKKYWFLFRDIANLMVTSLSNSSNLFSCPLPVKNPYNNVYFQKSHLYTMYFALLTSSLRIPEIIHGFFYCNFNISELLVNYEHVIRQNTLERYITNLPEDMALESIMKMIDFYNEGMPKKYKIAFHSEFPKKSILRDFRHFLFDFYNADYSLITNIKLAGLVKVKSNLVKFKKQNPSYGRKILSINNNKKTVIRFIDSVVKNSALDNTNEFLTSHLKATYKNIVENYSDGEDDEMLVFNHREEEHEEDEEEEEEQEEIGRPVPNNEDSETDSVS